MISIQTTATVSEDGQLTVEVPVDMPPGEHNVVLVVSEEPIAGRKQKITFSAHDIGPGPRILSLRREDLYGDDGR